MVWYTTVDSVISPAIEADILSGSDIACEVSFGFRPKKMLIRIVFSLTSQSISRCAHVRLSTKHSRQQALHSGDLDKSAVEVAEKVCLLPAYMHDYL